MKPSSSSRMAGLPFSSAYISQDLWHFFFLQNRGKLPDGNKLLEGDDIIKLKRCILGAKVSFSNPFADQMTQKMWRGEKFLKDLRLKAFCLFA